MLEDDDIAEMFIHAVTVETYAGSGAYGDTWEPESAPVACFIDESRRLVRDQHGSEVVSEMTVLTALGAADRFTPGSRVHVRGRVVTVIGRSRFDGEALELPSHTEVSLT